MKKLLFALLLFCASCIANAQNNYLPSLKEVVDKFDKTYAFKAGVTYLRLSKNPLGWSVYEIEYKNGNWDKTNEQLFWSKKEKKYLPLQFNPKKNGATTLRSTVQNDAYNFERNYYYGYNEAAKDAIDELENKKGLNDTELEGLARAYSSYAASFVENTSTVYGKNNYLPDSSFITENLADSFIKYVDKGIETFKKLNALNPYYETVVGNIYIKYCNEHMYAYLTLCEWGYENKAKKYLVPNLYGEAFLSASKNYLTSVEDNSIVFSNGDNDTYPVIYIQLTQKYKPGINIINLSLLSKPRYVKMIRKGYGGFRPVSMSVHQKAYNSTATAFASVNQKDGTTPTITTSTDLINFFNTYYNRYTNNDYPKLGIEKSAITMDVNAKACIANQQLNAKEPAPENITLEFKSYLIRNTLAVLDIITTNNWKNTIYIATGLEDLKLNKYLLRTGILYILSPVRTTASYEHEIENDENRLYNNIMKNFAFDASKEFKGAKGKGFGINIFNLRRAYSDYLKDCDTEDADIVAEKALALVPNNYTPYREELLGLASCWVKTNPQKAEQLLITIAQNKYANYVNPKPLLQFHYNQNYEKQHLESILEYIGGIAQTHNLSNLQAALEEINKKLNP